MPSTKFLEDLTRHEDMPQPLGEWVRNELDCGLGPTLDRLALCVTLEATCGIPPLYRRVKTDPSNAALRLAREALARLHHWWDGEVREAHLTKLKAAAEAGELTRLLGCWCSYRRTQRLKEAADAEPKSIAA